MSEESYTSALLSFHKRVASYLIESMEQVELLYLSSSEQQRVYYDLLLPYFRDALTELDRFFGLECSLLFIKDVYLPGKLIAIGTTAFKAELFRYVSFSFDSSFLKDIVLRRLIEPVSLKRKRYIGDRLWGHIWKNMHVGPYAYPWSLVAIPLCPKDKQVGTVSEQEIIGCLILIGPEGWNPFFETKEGHVSSEFLVDQFRGAVKHLMSSTYLHAVGSADQRTVLHGILAPLQTQELNIHVAELAIASGDREDVRKRLSNIRTEMFNVERSVRNFLELSLRTANETGEKVTPLSRKEECTETERTVMTVRDYLEGLAKRKDHTVKLRLTAVPRVPMKQTDFELVIRNLLHNAIKYSYPETTIEIRCPLRDPELVLEVISHGIPIQESDHEKIFHPGYRTPAASKMEYAAAGIGLFTSRRTVEGYGGRLYVHESIFEEKTEYGDMYRNVFRFVINTIKRKKA